MRRTLPLRELPLRTLPLYELLRDRYPALTPPQGHMCFQGQRGLQARHRSPQQGTGRPLSRVALEVGREQELDEQMRLELGAGVAMLQNDRGVYEEALVIATKDLAEAKRADERDDMTPACLDCVQTLT